MTRVDLRPDVATFLAGVPDVDAMLGAVPMSQMRAMEPTMRDMWDLPVGPLAVDHPVTADTEAGRVPLRLFDSRPARPAGPIMVFCHAGGFWGGSSEFSAPFCAEASRVLDMAVVAVDYRLAPEEPFPAGVADCEAAARWIASNPPSLERTATELVMCGDSAGGTMAIATTMALRDKPASRPVRAQFLLYPPTDLSRSHPSRDEFGTGHLLTAKTIDYVLGLYAADADDWRASPLLGSQDDMPPSVVFTVSHDPLRDEGRAYAAKLVEAGVSTIFHEVSGNVHGFCSLRKAVPSCQDDVADGFAALKTLLGTDSPM